MRTPTLSTLLFLLSIVWYSETHAQFTLSGEIRPRTEFRNGFKTLIGPDQNPTLFTEQRSRLIAGFTDEKVEFKLSVQDIRIWGAATQVYKQDPAMMNVNEAWGGYKISKSSMIKAGRMELNYDNARILGDLVWASQSRSHDVLKFEWHDSLTMVHVGAAFNQDALTPEPGKLVSTFYNLGGANYKTMQYLWANRVFKGGAISLLAMNVGFQAGVADADSTHKTYFQQTIGIVPKYKLNNQFSLDGEYYYQMGKDAADNNVSALYACLNLNVKTAKSLSNIIGFEYLSGNDTENETYGAFNPYFGTNHKFNGWMDYFYVGSPHRNTGLIDIYLKSNIKTGEKSSLGVNIHNFSSAVEVTETATGDKMSGGLGTEIDLVYMKKLAPNAILHIGYSQLFATKTMQEIKPGPGTSDTMQNWAWVMFTIKPKFL